MISKRIQEIAKYVEGYASLADIACDHGYLGIYVATKYHLDEILLTDINELPLKSAINNASKLNISNIYFKLGDGLAPLDHDYDVICIAGLGGHLLVDILKDGLNRAKAAKRLILSPNCDTYVVREFLAKNGFNITFEEMIFDKKYYQIIIANYTGLNICYTTEELTFGPILLKTKSDIFIKYYEDLLKRLENEYKKIRTENNKENLLNKIETIKKILK